MFDQDTLSQLHANYLATRPQPKVQPKKKKGGRGGTPTSLISEGGAIGGGALGASIGTGILPGIGTLLGGALGAGIGAVTGRVTENKVRDDRLGIGDALKEGAVSTVLGAGPLRLAKAATTATKAVKGGVGLADALAQGGERAVGMNATKAVGDKLAKSGEGLIAKEFRLNPTQQANFKKLHGEEAVSVLRKYGVKKPEDLQASIKPLQDAFDGVVKDIPDISRGAAEETLRGIYQPLINSPVLVRKQLGEQLKAQADEVLKTFPNKQFIASSGGEVVGEMGADQAKKKLGQLTRLIKKSQTKGGVSGDELRAAVREKQTLETAIKGGTTRTADSIPAASLNELRKAFDDAVSYTQRGTNEFTVNKKSADALRKLLQGSADDAGITVGGQTFKDVGLELRKLRNLDDIVGKQAYLGTGSLPASLPNLLGAAGGGAAAGGPGGAALGLLGTALVNSGPGRRAMANTTLKAGEKIAGKATRANPYGVKALTSRVAPASLAGALLQGGDQSSGLRNAQENQMTTINSSDQPISANIPGLYQTDANMSTDDPLAPENLQSSIQQILANGGSLSDAKEFVGLAEALQKLQVGTQPKPIKKTEGQRARDEAAALTDDALAQLQRGSVNTGPISAPLENFKSIFNQADPETLDFNTTVDALKAAIAKARAGTSFTPNEEKLLNRYAPKSGDSMQKLTTKLQNLKVLYRQAAEREYGTQYAESPTDLAGALAASGY